MKIASFRSLYRRRRFDQRYSNLTPSKHKRSELCCSNGLEDMSDPRAWDLVSSTGNLHNYSAEALHNDQMNSVTAEIIRTGLSIGDWYESLKNLSMKKKKQD